MTIITAVVSAEPFVGRRQELERLREAFDGARDGRGSLVMITGEPGIGKTRLARELEGYASEHGARVLWGRAHEAGGAPAYWPWVQALRQLVEATDGEELRGWLGSGAGEVARVVPELRAHLPDLPEPEPITDPESAQFRLFDALATCLRNVASATPPVLVLDDLHWADRSTLLLLEHVALELSRANLLLVGTYRDVELGRQHPLEQALAGIGRAERFQTIDLPGLSEEDAASYVRATTGVELPAEAMRSIYHETEGNAFFLQEVVALMAQEGTLESGDVSVPPSVRAAIGRRLNVLSEQGDELLRIAAVVGREFSEQLLARMSDHGAVPELLESVLAAGLIEETGAPGESRFTHALIQETLLGELSISRQVRLHGAVAESMERMFGARADEHAPELAHHYVQSATLSRQHAEKAARYSKIAAGQAAAQAGWHEAARRYEACLTVIAETDSALDEDEAALLTALGTSHRNAGAPRDAWRSLMRARTFYQQRGDGAGLARATLEALQVIAPPDRQIAIVQEALEAIGEDEPYLEAMLSAVVIGTIGRPAIDAETVADLEQRTRALVDRHHFEDVAALLLLADGVRLAYDGRLDEAAAACGQAHERLAALVRVSDAATAAYELVALRCVIGDLDAAERAGKEALAYASGVHLRLTEANLRVYLASVALSRCDFDRFDALAAELSGEDTTGFAQLLTTRAEMAGDGEGALASMPVPQMAGGIPAWLAWLHGCRARAFFNAGEERAAREEFGRSIEMSEAATGGDGRQPWPDSAAELDECLLALGDDALAGRVYWYLVGLMSEAKLGRLGRGLDHIRGALALRLDLVEEAEQHYRTGLEWAEREGVPIELGRCHQGLAEVAVRRGEIAEALEHLDTAAELFERHGAKLYLDQVRARQEELRPPARGRRASYPAGLTEREVEVLRLVAAGKANRAIAEALVISVSTVTHHITNIFNKLGVKNRAQATRRAVEHDLTQ